MAIKHIAEDIHNFIDLATTARNKWYSNEASWGPWFRGHKCASFDLRPTLYRYSGDPRSLNGTGRNIEDELRQEFTMRGPSFTSVQPQTSWDWYFLMQHSGAPTRLLDWTEGALIALYFALKDNDDKSDAAVWMLDPWWLNGKTLGREEVVPPGAKIGMSEPDAELYDPWLPNRFDTSKLPKSPVAIYPSHTVPRISSQRSCFTIHGSDRDGLEALASAQDARLEKIEIPASSVRKMNVQLVLCGIDELTIYPDLDGLGRSLTTTLKLETGRKA